MDWEFERGMCCIQIFFSMRINSCFYIDARAIMIRGVMLEGRYWSNPISGHDMVITGDLRADIDCLNTYLSVEATSWLLRDILA